MPNTHKVRLTIAAVTYLAWGCRARTDEPLTLTAAPAQTPTAAQPQTPTIAPAQMPTIAPAQMPTDPPAQMPTDPPAQMPTDPANANDVAPTLIADGPYTTTSLDSILLDVTANDTDVDIGDTPRLVSVAEPTLAGVATGSAVIENGKIRFTPADPAVGVYRIAYVESDKHGATASGSVSVTVALGARVTSSLSSSQARVIAGQTVFLTWSSNNATACTLSGGGGTISTALSGTAVPFSPEQPGPPTLTCTGDGGPITNTLSMPFQPAIFVDDNPSGSAGDGTSWENAYTNVQAAIDSPGNVDGVQIWLKAGTYRAPSPIQAVADIQTKAHIFGGFAQSLSGTGGDVGLRDSSADKTILDGDQNGDDPAVADNACHVVRVVSVRASLDGLEIAHGNAAGVCPDVALGGGGLYVAGATLALASVVIHDNQAQGSELQGARGGGLYVVDSTLTLTKVTFTANQAATSPGGSMGRAAWGGAIYAESSLMATALTISDSTFFGNAAQGGTGDEGYGAPGASGGEAYGGALYLTGAVNSSLNASNTTFAGNAARGGKGGDGHNGGSLTTCTDGTAGGAGGDAQGGAIYDGSAWSIAITGGSFNDNLASAGAAGRGGNGGSPSRSLSCTHAICNGGNGGNGGVASAGAIEMRAAPNTMLLNGVALDSNIAQGGAGAAGGNACSAAGAAAGTGGDAGCGGDAAGSVLDIANGMTVAVVGCTGVTGNGLLFGMDGVPGLGLTGGGNNCVHVPTTSAITCYSAVQTTTLCVAPNDFGPGGIDCSYTTSACQ